MNGKTKLRAYSTVVRRRELAVAEIAADLGWSVQEVIDSFKEDDGTLADAIEDSSLLDGYDDSGETVVTEARR